MIDNNSILNCTVQNAAIIMKNKLEYNKLVLEHIQSYANPNEHDLDRIRKLTDLNKRIEEAIKVMEENEGCWI